MSIPLLLFEDYSPDREAFEELLSESFEVSSCSTVHEAIELLTSESFSVAVLDMASSEQDREAGLRVLKHIAENELSVSSIVLTGAGTIENCVEAMKLGALDYVVKGKEETADKILSAAITASTHTQAHLRVALNRETEMAFRAICVKIGAGTFVELIQEESRQRR